ncbi:MAG: Fe2+/Zn2+ uptake regulation protein [Candidatus Roizmanbacteria bacterium GW2011_GWA2_37_7]|uniref:Fe2+/Zn2+ uptake regulation protein n=1 Tax=Candidatus Roizmanbacteria bacterium GW2011_GWA2_37_7 TaxID=1618481 RepID=A0A0G0JMV6_9BACT|nr:MAG: Fe2+/Zn2+ uptake regulation protein [Candidatus Roizmanbacteria bacterium GW2011_GWA2_37_7]
MITNHLLLLQKKGFRMTQARSSILNLLENTDHPLTATSIHKILKRIGVSTNITTIYRELEFLLEQKIIEKIPLFDTELHYEISGRTHHHHLMCTSCGSIQNIVLQSEKGLLEEMHNISTYDIRRHSLAFFGTCPDCT